MQVVRISVCAELSGWLVDVSRTLGCLCQNSSIMFLLCLKSLCLRCWCFKKHHIWNLWRKDSIKRETIIECVSLVRARGDTSSLKPTTVSCNAKSEISCCWSCVCMHHHCKLLRRKKLKSYSSSSIHSSWSSYANISFGIMHLANSNVSCRASKTSPHTWKRMKFWGDTMESLFCIAIVSTL